MIRKLSFDQFFLQQINASEVAFLLGEQVDLDLLYFLRAVRNLRKTDAVRHFQLDSLSDGAVFVVIETELLPLSVD